MYEVDEVQPATPLERALKNGFVTIAQNQEFVLLIGPEATSEWRSLKLIAPKRKGRRNWMIGWNGVRLANNRDLKYLNEHLPRMEIWITNAVKGWDIAGRDLA